MTLSKNAIVSAIRGAFVADAASMGTHWIYDPKAMAQAVDSVNEPEFKNPPNPSYYGAEEFPNHYGPGMLSPYGEQLLFVTEHVAAHGTVDGKEMSDKFFEWLDSEYQGRPDSAAKALVGNVKAGKSFPECAPDDHQAHCFMKVVPVTCLYAGKPELKAKVEEAVRVHQNNDVAVAFGVSAACILERALLERALPDDEFIMGSLGVDQQSKDAWKRAEDASDLETLFLEISHEVMKGKEDSPMYDLMGRSCALPQAFIGPCFLFQTSNDYEKAVRANILGAGDTCSRGVFIGAVIGAVSGGPPEAWVEKMDQETLARIDAAANKIAEIVGAE